MRNTLTATASKTGADGSALTMTLTGSTAATSLQWQRYDGANCVDIAGATNSTLTYSSFATDATRTATTFSIGADNYTGTLYTVQLRLHASRVLNGITCDAYSSAVTVTKVVAVDP